MGLNSVVPCIACHVNTSNPHCFCSDQCWDDYHRELHDPDVMAEMYSEMKAEEHALSVWADDGGQTYEEWIEEMESRLTDEDIFALQCEIEAMDMDIPPDPQEMGKHWYDNDIPW